MMVVGGLELCGIDVRKPESIRDVCATGKLDWVSIACVYVCLMNSK